MEPAEKSFIRCVNVPPNLAHVIIIDYESESHSLLCYTMSLGGK